MMYVREGIASILEVNSEAPLEVSALQSATFSAFSGDTIVMRNPHRQKTLDFLLLAGKPLREEVAMAGGPIVMNTEQEIYDAYQQLADGTFLERDIVVQQQANKK